MIISIVETKDSTFSTNMCSIFVLERVFACSQDLKIKKDDVTRCTVQKSVCILSSLVSDIVQCI